MEKAAMFCPLEKPSKLSKSAHPCKRMSALPWIAANKGPHFPTLESQGRLDRESQVVHNVVGFGEAPSGEEAFSVLLA